MATGGLWRRRKPAEARVRATVSFQLFFHAGPSTSMHHADTKESLGWHTLNEERVSVLVPAVAAKIERKVDTFVPQSSSYTPTPGGYCFTLPTQGRDTLGSSWWPMFHFYLGRCPPLLSANEPIKTLMISYQREMWPLGIGTFRTYPDLSWAKTSQLKMQATKRAFLFGLLSLSDHPPRGQQHVKQKKKGTSEMHYAFITRRGLECANWKWRSFFF